MNINDLIANIAKEAGVLAPILYLLAVTALADTAIGVWAALQSGTFNLSYLDSFVTSHILQKWGPILGTLLGGFALGGVDNLIGGALVAAGTAQIVAYEAATFGSITGNFSAAAAKTKGLPGELPGVTPTQLGTTDASVSRNPAPKVAPPGD